MTTHSSPAPLTEAEAAAALELSRIYNRRDDIPFESEPADHADEARAVVAAVRPILAAEALRSTRKSITEHKERLRADRSRLGQRFEGRCSGLEEAAGMCTTAIKALSLPASKETSSEEVL